jgi:hypothetical protein
MASAHIEISGSASRLNGQVRSALNQLQSVKEDIARLKTVFDQLALGADWDALGAALGLSAAEAETVYNLWGSMNSELTNASFVNQTLQRLG